MDGSGSKATGAVYTIRHRLEDIENVADSSLERNEAYGCLKDLEALYISKNVSTEKYEMLKSQLLEQLKENK